MLYNRIMLNHLEKLIMRVHRLFKFGIYRYLKYKLSVFVKSFSRTKNTFNLTELPEEPGVVSLEVKNIFQETRSIEKKPKFCNLPEYIDSQIYDGKQLSPAVALHLINEVHVVGRTEFIIKGNKAYIPRVITPEADMFMAEIEGWASISENFQTLSLTTINAGIKVKKAVSLFGQANANYLHFLTETLTRLVVLDNENIHKEAVILIEDNLHPKFYDALSLLNINERPVIRVSPYEKVAVENLIYITPLCYTPPETRDWFQHHKLAPPRAEQFYFSKQGLELLRRKSVELSTQYLPYTKHLAYSPNSNVEMDYLITNLNNPTRLSDIKKVYLYRHAVTTGNGRLLKNQTNLVDLLTDIGFMNFDIAELPFYEQVHVLRNAQTVISPVGAALGNMIFCEPGVKVILLSPTYPGATFFYFTNLLSCLGHEVSYVLGKQDPTPGHGYQEFYNRDFTIPINMVLSELSNT